MVGEGAAFVVFSFDPRGVLMVLHTAFNENEPVVCEPEDALGRGGHSLPFRWPAGG